MSQSDLPFGTQTADSKAVSTILIIDDDLISALVLENILNKEGFVVFKSESGREGREIAGRVKPDLILLDINMPGEDGLTTCRALKADAATVEIPVIFISAMDDVNCKIEGFNAGGIDYVTKPFHPVEVLARVRLHLRMKQAYMAMTAAHLTQIHSLADAQQMMMPQPGDLPEARFSAVYLPMLMAGGDFYDVFCSGQGIFEYYVADISGHDLGTSLATAALKALIRQNAQMLYPPLDNLSLVNRHIRTVLNEGQYVTLLYAQLNRTHLHLTLLNAGNPAPILVQKCAPARMVPMAGDVLGAFDMNSIEPYEVDVAHGDRIFLFSDGLIEQGINGPIPRRQGMADLLELCEQTRRLALDRAVEAIIECRLPERSRLVDDVVLLAIDV